MRTGLPLESLDLLIYLVFLLSLLGWAALLLMRKKPVTAIIANQGNKMTDRYVIETLLRPAVELNTAVAAACASYICVTAPWAVALAPSVSYVTAAGFAILSLKRTHEGFGLTLSPQYPAVAPIP